MNETHASALALVRELFDLGATHVKVDSVEVRFDRVFVPLKPQSSETLAVEVDGDEVLVSRDEVQSMRDELEHLRSMRRQVEALGVI